MLSAHGVHVVDDIVVESQIRGLGMTLDRLVGTVKNTNSKPMGTVFPVVREEPPNADAQGNFTR